MSLPENFNSSNLNPLSSNPLDFNANIDPLGLPSGLNNTKQILVIAPDIDDYQSLIDGINPQIVEVVKLNLATDGILQISDVLKRYQGQGIDAVHIATHGGAGNLKLGSVDLNTQTLRNYQSDLESWGNALTNDADILFYGCNLAATKQGRSLVEKLSQLTGADVAASDDLTGNKNQGGDWNLEVETGIIETGLPWQNTTLANYDSVFETINSDTILSEDKTYSDGLTISGGNLIIKGNVKLKIDGNFNLEAGRKIIGNDDGTPDSVTIIGNDDGIPDSVTINGLEYLNIKGVVGGLGLNAISITAGNINITDSATLLTRQISTTDFNAGNYVSGSSIGKSGDITMKARNITIGDTSTTVVNGAKLLAQVESGSSYTAGKIKLETYNEDERLPLAFGGTNQESRISLDEVTLRGGAIEITSVAKDIAYNEHIPQAVTEALGFFNLDNSVFYQFQSLGIPLAVQVRQSQSYVTVNNSTITSSGSVTISADAQVDSSVEAISMSGSVAELTFSKIGKQIRFAGAGGKAKGVAETSINGNTVITASGSVSVKSNVKTTAKVEANVFANAFANANTLFAPNTIYRTVGATTQPADIVEQGYSVAVAITDTTSKATLGKGATITAGGNVKVDAVGSVDSQAKAKTTVWVNGKVGVGVSVNLDKTDITTTIDGNINAVGLVTSKEKNSIDKHKIGTNTIGFDSDHNFVTGDKFVYSNDLDPARLLTEGTVYDVLVLDSKTIALTPENALAGVIDIDNSRVNTGVTQGFSRLDSVTFDGSNTAKDTNGNAITTVNAAANTITINNHGLVQGQQVIYYADPQTTEDEEIGDLQTGGTYFVIVKDSNTIQLAETQDNVVSGTPVDLTVTIGQKHLFSFYDRQKLETPQFNGATAVSIANDTITIADHGLYTGQLITYNNSGGTSISVLGGSTNIALQNGDSYFVIKEDNNTIKLATTYQDAINYNITTDTGTIVNISAIGSGSNHKFSYETSKFTFDPKNNSIIDKGKNIFTITDHKLTTGDRILYEADQTVAKPVETLTYLSFEPKDQTDLSSFVNAVDNSITVNNNSYKNADSITYKQLVDLGIPTDTLYTERTTSEFTLNTNSQYYVIKDGDNSFKLALTQNDANNGIAINLTKTQASNVVDITTDIITKNAHGYITGSAISLSALGSIVDTATTSYGGVFKDIALNQNSQYYVIVVNKNLIKLALTPNDANYGVAINLNSTKSSNVNLVSDGIKALNHGYKNGSVINLSSLENLINADTPLNKNTQYYVVRNDDDTFKLALTQADANSGTAIDLIDTQSVNAVNTATNIITKTGHGYTTGTAINLTTLATLLDTTTTTYKDSSPHITTTSYSKAVTDLALNQNSQYYVIKTDDNSIKLALTQENATNGIAINLINSQSSSVNLTTDIITKTAHGYSTGTAINQATLATLLNPATTTYSADFLAPLFKNETYYIIKDVATPNKIKLALSAADASSSTAIDFVVPSQSGLIDVTNDKITVGSNNYQTKDEITFSQLADLGVSSNTLYAVPTNLGLTLDKNSQYYAIRVDDSTIKLALTLADANSVDAKNVSNKAIDISDTFASNLNTTTDTITRSNHGYQTGAVINQAALKALLDISLNTSDKYYVIRTDNNTIKLALTEADANNGIALNITSTQNSNVDIATDTITKASHGYQTGDTINRIDIDALLDISLYKNDQYYIIKNDNNSIYLALSLADATNGIALDLTGTKSNNVNTKTDAILKTGHGYNTGDVINKNALRTLLASVTLDQNTQYYVIRNDDSSIKLALTSSDATNGIAIDLISTQSSNVDVSTNIITKSSHGYQTGATINLTTLATILGTTSTTYNGANTTSYSGAGTTVFNGGEDTTIYSAGFLDVSLDANTEYYVIFNDSNSFKLALNRTDAKNSIAIDLISTANSGSVNLIDNIITKSSHGYKTGDTITLAGLQTAITPSTTIYREYFYLNSPLYKNEKYYIIKDGSNGIKLALSATDAQNGKAIDLVVSSDLDLKNDTIYLAGHGLKTKDKITYQTDFLGVAGTPIKYNDNGVNTPLVAGQDYWAIVEDSNRIRLALSESDAEIGKYLNLTVASSDVLHSFAVTDKLTSGDNPIQGLLDGRYYYAIVIDDNRFMLAETDNAALEAEPIKLKGDAINISTTGLTSGNHGLSPEKFLTFDGSNTAVVNQSSGTLTIPNHGLVNGQIVTYTSDPNGKTSIGELTHKEDYFVIVVDNNTIKLANTIDDAAIGNALDVNTAVGTGHQLAYEKFSKTTKTATNVSDDIITIANHGLSTGDFVTYNLGSGGTAISTANGTLIDKTGYFVIRISQNTIKLAETYEKAIAATPTAIDLTGSGTGTQSFTYATSSISFDPTNTAVVDPTKETFTITDNGLKTGDRVLYQGNNQGNTAENIDNLTSGNYYYVVNIGKDFRSDNLRELTFNSADGSVVNKDNDTITLTNHGLYTGQKVTYKLNGATTVGSLSDATDYYVIVVDTNTIKLAEDYNKAINKNSINLKGVGEGHHSLLAPREFNSGDASVVNLTDNKITLVGHGFFTGERITYKVNGTKIGNLDNDTTYFAIVDDANTIRLATTYNDAIASTPIAKDLTTLGSGAHTFYSLVDPSKDTITLENHGLVAGQSVTYKLNSSGTDVGGLTNAGKYYVIVVDANTIKLAASNADAIAGTAIDITALGIGTHAFIYNDIFKLAETKDKAFIAESIIGKRTLTEVSIDPSGIFINAEFQSRSTAAVSDSNGGLGSNPKWRDLIRNVPLGVMAAAGTGLSNIFNPNTAGTALRRGLGTIDILSKGIN